MLVSQRRMVMSRALVLRVLFAWATVLVASVVSVPDAVAGGRRARVSEDLARRIDAGDPSSTSVIITGTQASIDAIAARHGVIVRKRLKTGAVLEVDGSQLGALANDASVEALSGDHDVRATMATTNVAIGADQAWAGIDGLAGVTGAGVGVAVIDSGIANHPALKSRVVASVDFTSSNGRGDDQYGHGTHVAGIIAAASSSTTGVAPGAHLVSLKVLNADGSGKTSDVIAAIDYAVSVKDKYRLRVINLSLGHPVVESWRDDPLCQAVERAYRAGLVVVASAGNMGKLADGRQVLGGITSPGNSPFALTVGALNTKGTPFRSDDVVATYSSKGPTRFDLLIKPDLVAPGNRIESLAAPGSTLVREHPELVTGSGQQAQLQLSGTSMAAAVVSGAAAIIVAAQPEIRPAGVRATLQATAGAVDDAGLIQAGTGSLNVIGAATLVTTGTLPSLVISGESVVPRKLMTGSADSFSGVDAGSLIWGHGVIWGNSVIWGYYDSVIWGNSDSVIWGNADGVIWGNSDSVIWGNADGVIWGNGDGVIWGNSDSVIWGYSDGVIWGNSVIWGE